MGHRFKGGLAVFALGENGLLQTATKVVGQRVDLMLAVDFDGLPGGVQRDDAVLAAAEMFFEVGPKRRGYLVVNQVVELRQKLRAGHFAPSLPFLRK